MVTSFAVRTAVRGYHCPMHGMRLTMHTEYGIYALMHIARSEGDAPTARQIAEAIGLPLNHLVKIVHRLRQAGFLETARGRVGGTWLARPAAAITLGEVVRTLEHPFALVECLHVDGHCVFANHSGCGAALTHALAAYLAVLDRYSIEDLLR